jgi:DNA mismatch endonuclease (patch repair protein)
MMMSRIRGRGNRRTETDVIGLLRKSGIKGWRRHQTIRFGLEAYRKKRASDGTRFKAQVRPDFSFPKLKVALFIDGCFWHGCPKCYRRPKSRRRFWTMKVRRNKERDKFQTFALRRCGWYVVRILEHDLRRTEKCMTRIRRALESPANKKPPNRQLVSFSVDHIRPILDPQIRHWRTF